MSDSIIYENEKTGIRISYAAGRRRHSKLRPVGKTTYYHKAGLLNGKRIEYEELAICPVSERKDYSFTRFYDFYEEDQLNFRNGYKIVKGEENVEYFQELSGFSRKDLEHALKHTSVSTKEYVRQFSENVTN